MTPKQAMFVAEYLIDGNATRAALAVGFSEKSAAVTGARLLKNRRISSAIAERQARMAAKLEITAERVLQEIAKLAYFDPRELYDEQGHLKPIRDLNDMCAAAIAGLEVEAVRDPGGIVSSITRKVKLADKGQNLERLGRYLKLFTDRVEHDGRVTLEQLVTGHGEASGGGEQAA